MLALIGSGLAAADAGDGGRRVLTALPALHALTATLCEGTRIDVSRLPAGTAVPMEAQSNALTHLQGELFTKADAVVTLRGLWRADPLYPVARSHNLGIIEIDATRSWDAAKPGLAVVETPRNDVPWGEQSGQEAGPSPYAWLGADNGARMAALIAADLMRLSPADANRIARNLAALEQRLRRLKAGYGVRMAALRDPKVLSLANEFAYLLGEFGVFVEGWDARQDVDWRDSDRSALSDYLRRRDIRLVVHKWRPDERIVKAIERGGARLLILDAGNPGLLAGEDGEYEALLRWNIDTLLTALETTADDAARPAGDSPPIEAPFK
ncbi:metal ABC transporter solute-binding protein, Zn/Mn family [Burkholderia sp. LMU1-1-1.1]|uniref:metal ABC transporter solute-binding protein, Zn/Mn family n=1 Tax=Burkholderia sp. LMU1-1-1.1 TaxID=3135266 RepID=UPI00342B67A4